MKFELNRIILTLLSLELVACSPRLSQPKTQNLPEESVLAEGTAKPKWPPLPHEDRVKGRNSNAYEPYIGEKDKVGFIKKASIAALKTCREHKIPASAIVGMAAVESGYGSARLGYNANNYFSTKLWGTNPKNAWQLVGQPDESMGSQDITKVKENLGGPDRLIFDETSRADNRYRAFKTPEDGFRYLAEAFLKRPNKAGQSKGFINAADKWLTTVTQNPNGLAEASKQYLADIGDAGYTHLGGTYYRKHVTPVMDEFNLYELDKECLIAEPVPSDLLTINEIKVFPTVDSDNATAKGMVNIQVKVTDLGSGMDRVEFYFARQSDNEAKSTDILIKELTKPTDPVDSVYLIPWDTTKAGPDGSYSVIIQAYDKAGTFRMKTRTIELKNGKNAAAAPITGSVSPAPAGDTKPVNGNFGQCKANGRKGSCIDKAYCQGGTTVPGLCGGPASVMCCIWN